MATVFGFASETRKLAMAGPCWSSRPTVRKVTEKPCSVRLVAEPEIIGMPAVL